MPRFRASSNWPHQASKRCKRCGLLLATKTDVEAFVAGGPMRLEVCWFGVGSKFNSGICMTAPEDWKKEV